MSRWIDEVSIDSGRPSRRRAKWLSAADSSAARIAVFSASSFFASYTSRDMNTLKASWRLSETRR